MGETGYLTRGDKFALAVSVLILIPLATMGFAFLALGLVILIFGALAFSVGKGIWELITGRRKRVTETPRTIRLTHLQSKPAKIRHQYTINTSEPRIGKRSE